METSLSAAAHPCEEGEGPDALDRSSGEQEAASGVTASVTVGALFEANFDFIWRSLRRLGLDDARADDAAQEVFLVAARKADQIEAGRERSFLFGTALRVAADLRKAAFRRREVAEDAELPDPGPSPEALLDAHRDQERARATLDELLDALPQDVRVVFVLYELEELEMQDIAALLGLHQGTVASRLRRGRAMFAAAAKRHQARASWNDVRKEGGR